MTEVVSLLDRLAKTPPQSPGFSHGELQQMPINRQGA